MISALVCVLLWQDLPKTFEDLTARMNQAYHGLGNYTDTWDLTDEASPGTATRAVRLIDGKRSILHLARVDLSTGAETPLSVQGANGRECFGVVFGDKSYYRMGDDGSLFAAKDERSKDISGFRMAVENYSIRIECKPPLELKSIESDRGQIATGRVVNLESVDPETKRRVSVRMTFLNRWWLPTDIVATVSLGDGKPNVIRLHPTLMAMNVHLPKKGFDFDTAWIAGFTKKTREEVTTGMSGTN